MKKLFKCISLVTTLTLACFFNAAYCQSVPGIQSTLFSKGRFYTTSGEKVKFYILMMDGDVSKYKVSSNDSTFKRIPTDKIKKIQKLRGAKAMVWGAILGCTAGLSIADRQDGITTTNGQPASFAQRTAFVVETTATGTLIGALIYAVTSKYITVYTNKPVAGLNETLSLIYM